MITFVKIVNYYIIHWSISSNPIIGINFTLDWSISPNPLIDINIALDAIL